MWVCPLKTDFVLCYTYSSAKRAVSVTMVKKVSGRPKTTVDFDALLPYIGEFGPYQITFYLLMCVPTMPAAFLAFNQET